MSAPGSVGIAAAVVATLAWMPAPARAQTSELSVEVGASRVLPPTGVDGDAAAFVVAGLRGSRWDLAGTGVHGSLLVGRSLDGAAGGDFVSGEVGAAGWRVLGGGWSAGVEARALAFGVEDPFSYRAAALEGTGALRYRAGVLRASLSGVGGVGRSRVTLSTLVQRRRHGEATAAEVLEDDLWRVGGNLELLAGGGPVAAGVAGGVHRGAGGTYRSAGLRLLGGAGGGVVELRVDAWDTPDGGETTGGLAFHVPWGGWSARGMAGRPEPDPLLLAEPGRGAGGFLVGRRIAGGPSEDAADRGSVYRVGAATAGGSVVRFQVEVPGEPGAVAVLGDFTLWEPVAMEPAGSGWRAAVEVPAGTHHFGFLVDGSWFVPEDAPDAVPDEWGRRSLTLVIEEREGS